MKQFAASMRIAQPSATATALLGAALSLALACATSEPKLEMGPGATVTADGLHKVQDSRLANAYVRPGADLSTYDHVIVEMVAISYKSPPGSNRYSRDKSNFPLRSGGIDLMKAEFQDVFVQELDRSGVYSQATEPGPNTLILRAEIVDLVVRVPPDQGSARTHVFVESAGELTLVAELADSRTGATLARIIDRKAVRPAGAGQLSYSTSVGNLGALRRIYRGWARSILQGMETAHTLGVVTVAP